MTTAGLLVMLISTGVVTTLLTVCVWRVMTQPDEEIKEHHLGSSDLHTPDMDEVD